jgi:SAM-dependent methyltransferase
MRNERNGQRITVPRRSEKFTPRRNDLERVIDAANQIDKALSSKPSWFDYYVRNHSARIAFDLELVSRWLPTGEPIAEIGSCPLLLTAALKNSDYQVYGVDVDPGRFLDAIEKLGLSVFKCDIEQERLPFEDNSLAGLIINEVFEHLRINLVATFRELWRVLKPGAVLLLSTPNGASFSNVYNLMRHDRGLDDPIYESYAALEEVGHMGHVREYTLSDVAEFLGRSGFAATNAIYRGRYSTNIGQLIARLWPRMRPQFTIVAHKVDLIKYV